MIEEKRAPLKIVNNFFPTGSGEEEKMKWEENHPKDEPVANPLEADPPATPKPVVWGRDPITGEVKTAFAALVHNVRVVKGRIGDCGWIIRWFDNAAEAAKADAEARREAESYLTARKLEAELTADVRAIELPVSLPVEFVAFTPDLDEVMRQLGFTAEQFRIEGEGPVYRDERRYVGSVRLPMEAWGNSWSSKYADRYETVKVEYWWQKDGEVIVIFNNVTISSLLGEYGHELGVAKGFATAENIRSAKKWLEGQRRKAEDNYRTVVREFVHALQSQPVFACLSPGAQAWLAGQASKSWGTPSIDEATIRAEWAKAEALMRRQSAGEVLVNWGGHFRVMGATRNQQFWVIQPDGSERRSESIAYRGDYTAEGDKSWRLVGPDELAISWSKAYTAAPHEFVVAKLPAHGCTPEQLKTVSSLELEISERFYGARGMTGGAPSPEINGGWNLDAKSKPPKITPEPAKPTEPATPAAPASAEQIGDALAALRKKFGKK